LTAALLQADHVCAPLPPVRVEWVQPSDVIDRAPGNTPAARSQNLYRAIREARRDPNARGYFKSIGKRRFLLHIHARLFGMTVESLMAVGMAETICDRKAPPSAKTWSNADRRRFLDTHALLDAWKAYYKARPDVDREALVAPFAASIFPGSRPAISVSDWAVQVCDKDYTRRFSIEARALRQYADRVKPHADPNRFTGNIDRRGRAKGGERVEEVTGEVIQFGKRMKGPSEHLWKEFLEIAHANGNEIPLKAAWQRVADQAQPDQGDVWPSYRSICVRYAALPKGVRVMGRGGEQEYRDTCEPTAIRDYGPDVIRPLDVVSLDGRRLDIMGRARDSRRGWRKARFLVTNVMDISCRLVGGWDIRENEHSDGILCGVKMFCRDWGIPRKFYLDNGSAYATALGSHWRDRMQPLLGFWNSELVSALPEHARSKIVEPNWRVMKDEFDRWRISFWGGTPLERPEDADKLRIDELPTIDELREAWATFVIFWNNREHGGDGMFGLPPVLKWEQYARDVRKADPDVVDLLCSRMYGGPDNRGVTVGKNGVRFNNILYGHFDMELAKYLGRRVWLRIDPESAAYVVVCDEQGVPLCVATNQMLRGATRDDVRRVMQLQAHARKIRKEAAGATDYLLRTPAQQIMRERADAAVARTEEARKSLPAPPAQHVTLVRPDLIPAARKTKDDIARKASRRAPAALAAGAEGMSPDVTSNPRRRGFARLAEKAREEDLQTAAAPSHTSRWATLNYEREAAE
jgi:hypothetical protein